MCDECGVRDQGNACGGCGGGMGAWEDPCGEVSEVGMRDVRDVCVGSGCKGLIWGDGVCWACWMDVLGA